MKSELEECQKDFADMQESKLRLKDLRRNQWMPTASFFLSVLAIIIAFASLMVQCS